METRVFTALPSYGYYCYRGYSRLDDCSHCSEKRIVTEEKPKNKLSVSFLPGSLVLGGHLSVLNGVAGSPSAL